MKKNYLLGIDIGSTTVKLHLRQDNEVIFTCYERHYSRVREKALELIKGLSNYLSENDMLKVLVSGSAGIGISENCGLNFVQEVFATGETIKKLEPDANAVIELGGEDAKIIFFDKGGMDEKMNGSCAGGTGAFIDQMAILLDVTPDELDELSLRATQIYPIASRCGVFAKTDIQPLINQGAKKEDIAASVYQAVVNQTIAGLAQGRRIQGKVVFLGGALSYCKGLQNRFKETLCLDDGNAVVPEYARTSVALGAALLAEKDGMEISYGNLTERLEASLGKIDTKSAEKPLFNSKEEYEAFVERHGRANVEEKNIAEYNGKAYLGIDCGSTTTKLVLLDKDKNIIYSYYSANNGNPVEVVKEQLLYIYSLCQDRIKIASSAVTGYGEELIKSAFCVDYGIVETMAHFTSAKYFNPDVDFILDIGGQDIKCFKIRNNAVDSIMLNEACSSGCGSFIETFAASMGYDAEEFAKLGLFAKHPVDLGSRCTVFMNSSVKQAQRDGATVGDISAGLSASVVKNALYKVIRVTAANQLGKNVVVQGGTFLNDAILRAFENELGYEVVRPNIAGLMGAYGCAMYAMNNEKANTYIITEDKLKAFEHKSKPVVCNGCTNHCNLTVNTFSDKKRFVSGNKCEKGAGNAKSKSEIPDTYEYKYNYLISLKSKKAKLKIGIPMALGMYELAPFWNALFTEMGFETVFSGKSNKDLYLKGQYTIPSDTVCYPAKLMHGHIESLIEKEVNIIFYPSLTFNVKEDNTDNNFNCPVVAYYSELLNKNIEEISNIKFMYPYLNINNKKQLKKELYKLFGKEYKISEKTISNAIKSADIALRKYRNSVEQYSKEAINYAREHNKKILILAGRPYHIDPEINHSINKLAESLGFVVVSEDGVSAIAQTPKVNVLNQWTYHSRLYKAAQFAADNDDTQLVQLVSFGCGLDAITTDEVKSILETQGKLYTQIKIDEIANLGAVKIRLRSLLEAIEERSENNG